jgi:hypothetical protein
VIVDVDLVKLNALQEGIGWTLEGLEMSLGKAITPRMLASDKVAMWSMIRIARQTRALWVKEFPDVKFVSVKC